MDERTVPTMRSFSGSMALLMSVLASGCVPQPTATAAPTDFPPAGPYEDVPAGKAELYLFNNSGWTLVASDYSVTDNGREIASLSRGTCTHLLIEPGSHTLKSADKKVKFEALERYRFYFVVAYSPEKSWASPLAGNPMFVGFVAEAEGQELLKECKQLPPKGAQ